MKAFLFLFLKNKIGISMTDERKQNPFHSFKVKQKWNSNIVTYLQQHIVIQIGISGTAAVSFQHYTSADVHPNWDFRNCCGQLSALALHLC